MSLLNLFIKPIEEQKSTTPAENIVENVENKKITLNLNEIIENAKTPKFSIFLASISSLRESIPGLTNEQYINAALGTSRISKEEILSNIDSMRQSLFKYLSDQSSLINNQSLSDIQLLQSNLDNEKGKYEEYKKQLDSLTNDMSECSKQIEVLNSDISKTNTAREKSAGEVAISVNKELATIDILQEQLRGIL